MTPRLCKLVAALLALLAAAPLASAYVTTHGTGSATAAVGTLSAPGSVTTTTTTGASTAHVTWTGAALSDGTTAATGYVVTRIDATTGARAAACGSSATAPLAATARSCDDTDLADGGYRYAVTAVYHSWTASSSSSDVVTIHGDATAPTPAFTFPVAGSAYRAATWDAGCPTAGVCGTASDTGGTGVSSVEVAIRQGDGKYFDGAGFTVVAQTFLPATFDASTGAWSYAFDHTQLPADGSYTVLLRATDGAGNVSATVSRTFDYDATGPAVTLSPGRSADVNGWYNHAVTWTAAGTDPSGVASCQAPVSYSSPDSANASVSLSCTDTLGNTRSGSATFKYDASAPTGAITAPAAGSVSGTVALKAATASDATSGVASVAYRFCAGTTCTPSTAIGTGTAGPDYAAAWNTTQLANGPYRLSAVITDAAGNSQTTSVVSVTVANAYSFAVGTPGTQTAGTPFGGLTIQLLVNGTATSTYNGTAYSGSKAIAFSGPGTAPDGTHAPTYPATVTFTNGTATLPAGSVALYKAESTTLTARDGTAITGTSAPFAINSAGVALSYTPGCPLTVARGSTTSFTINVPRDAYNNPFTRVGGLSVALTLSNTNNFLLDTNPVLITSGPLGNAFKVTESGANKTTTLTASVPAPFTAPASCTITAN